MVKEMHRFKNVLCVVEDEESSQAALERALDLASNNQASLTVIAVVQPLTFGIGMPDGGPVYGDYQGAMLREREQRLEALLEPYRKQREIRSGVLLGITFLEVIREVLRGEYDLVIKCPEAPGWLDRIFTGDDMHLLRKCPCAVWLVNPKSGASCQRILAAVDVDDNYPPAELQTRQTLNESIMDVAGALAVSEFAQLHVVHTWAAVGESVMRNGAFVNHTEDQINAYVDEVRRHHADNLDKLMHQAEARLGLDAIDYVKPQLHLLKGSARREIPLLARELQVDCIVMGTVARTGVRGFIMGNTAETILGQINCSVLALKPPGFETPVELED
jgi:nucleotide-binding universal stress UspA family protein